MTTQSEGNAVAVPSKSNKKGKGKAQSAETTQAATPKVKFAQAPAEGFEMISRLPRLESGTPMFEMYKGLQLAVAYTLQNMNIPEMISKVFVTLGTPRNSTTRAFTVLNRFARKVRDEKGTESLERVHEIVVNPEHLDSDSIDDLLADLAVQCALALEYTTGSLDHAPKQEIGQITYMPESVVNFLHALGISATKGRDGLKFAAKDGTAQTPYGYIKGGHWDAVATAVPEEIALPWFARVVPGKVKKAPGEPTVHFQYSDAQGKVLASVSCKLSAGEYLGKGWTMKETDKVRAAAWVEKIKAEATAKSAQGVKDAHGNVIDVGVTGNAEEMKQAVSA